MTQEKINNIVDKTLNTNDVYVRTDRVIIPIDEYKELLMIKGKWEEKNENYNIEQIMEEISNINKKLKEYQDKESTERLKKLCAPRRWD